MNYTQNIFQNTVGNFSRNFIFPLLLRVLISQQTYNSQDCTQLSLPCKGILTENAGQKHAKSFSSKILSTKLFSQAVNKYLEPVLNKS